METAPSSAESRRTVLLFASLRERAGSPSIEVSLPEGSSVADLRRAITAAAPNLAEGLASSRIAIDQEFREDSDTVSGDGEIAVIPPVSGG